MRNHVVGECNLCGGDLIELEAHDCGNQSTVEQRTGYAFDHYWEILERKNLMTPAAAGNLNNVASDYPPEEWRIVRQLVRLIGNAPTWQNVLEASDALFHVEMMAKSMRTEHDHHAKAAAQSLQK